MARLLHVDAAQGNGEARNEAYKLVRRLSTGVIDAGLRHKPGGVDGNRRQAGRAVQEVAYVC